MSEQERIKRLEVTLDILFDALLRKNTEQDGNWGYPSFEETVTALRVSLKDSSPPEQP